jgi:hypothetical protein
MADQHKARKKKRLKRTWGKPPLRPSSLVAGEVRGELLVIEPDTGKRKNGHRLALVEDIKTGKRGEVRADNLNGNNTISLGRIKKERYREHMAKQISNIWHTDLDEIDAATLKAAREASEPPKKFAPPVQAMTETVTPTPVKPVVKKTPLELAWEGTDEGFRALELYVRTSRSNPPDSFNLKEWYSRESK